MILTHREDLFTIIVSSDGDKDTRSRMKRYVHWLAERGARWTQPQLAQYRDYLFTKGLAASSVKAHLSTVRSALHDMLVDNNTRQRLFERAGAELRAQGLPDDLVNRKASVDEIIIRVENDLSPAKSKVQVVTSQDHPDAAHVRLTKAQANTLLAAPGVSSRAGLRDTVLIALLLCTGIREQEAAKLQVQDLRQHLGGELALHVREGKGAKERLVPYGELQWCLVVVDAWLVIAGISEGRVFRSLWKGDKLRGSLTVRSVQRIVKKHGRQLVIDGRQADLAPHDLRRTYARRLFEAGVDPVAIQQNLGHASLETTLGYIGTLDAEQRRAPAIYAFDLSILEAGAEMWRNE